MHDRDVPTINATSLVKCMLELKVGAIEALSHRSDRTQRLFRLAATWAYRLVEQEAPRASYRTMDRLKPDQVQQLVAGYVGGATVYELAAQFGVDRKTVSRTLHRERVPMRMTGLSTEQIEEAQKLYGDGWSLMQIGERMRVDARTVHRRLRERGTRMRNTHGQER